MDACVQSCPVNYTSINTMDAAKTTGSSDSTQTIIAIVQTSESAQSPGGKDKRQAFINVKFVFIVQSFVCHSIPIFRHVQHEMYITGP